MGRIQRLLPSASRPPLFPLRIGLYPWVQALRTNPDIATLHSKLRLGIHSAPTELRSRHTFTCNAPTYITFICSGTTPSPPRYQSQPSPRRLHRPQSTARKEDALQTPSPCNLPIVVWTKRNLSAHHYNTPRARPAIIFAQHPLSQNGTPNTVSSAFSTFCERLLLMHRVWKQQREIMGLRDTL
jgi:hypothetical protein